MTLEKKLNLGPGQGMQIGVAVQYPRIEPGGLFALDVPLDLLVKLTCKLPLPLPAQ